MEEEEKLHSTGLILSQVARGGTYALWSLCKSKQNRLLIKKAGGFPLLARSVCHCCIHISFGLDIALCNVVQADQVQEHFPADPSDRNPAGVRC